LEEFGLETLEEPDYHDSECDLDKHIVEPTINKGFHYAVHILMKRELLTKILQSLKRRIS